MLVAHIVVRWFNPLLLFLGVILGVNQVALGLQLMLGGMEGLIAQGVFTAPGKMTLGGFDAAETAWHMAGDDRKASAQYSVALSLYLS
jgi:hypothetical protein